MKTINKGNVVNHIMEYEGGNITIKDYFKLFAYLIKTGQAWSLQGMYGRNAKGLIENGWITSTGRVNWKKIENAGIDINAMLYDE